MNRRRFFNRIAQAVAIVALAPQLCFRAPAAKVCAPEPKIDLTEFITACHDLRRKREASGLQKDTIDIYCFREAKDELEAAIKGLEIVRSAGNHPSADLAILGVRRHLQS